MKGTTYLVDSSTSPISDSYEILEPAAAFDWANLVDQGIRGASEVQNVWMVTAAQYNLAALQIYQQTFWFVPGMFLFDLFGQSFANLLEAQTGILRLMMQQSKIAAEMQADFTAAPVEAVADSFRRALDLLAGTPHEEFPEDAETKELTAAAA